MQHWRNVLGLLVMLSLSGCGGSKQNPKGQSVSPIPSPMASPEEQRETEAAVHSPILQSYRRLQTGMTSHEVQRVLGPAIELLTVNGVDKAWYDRRVERMVQLHESPYAIGSIGVTYRDGRLIEKQYNLQHISDKAREIILSK